MTSSSLLVPPPSSRWPVDPREIRPGIVLHLDPETLLAQGAIYSCDDDRRVIGCHFFLCIEVTGECGRWLPLYSRDGFGRVRLSQLGRSGHSKWVTSECHFHEDQVWRATHQAVVAAARVGHDFSEPGRRNRIAVESLPDV